MGLTIAETDFIAYMNEKRAGASQHEGLTLISLNARSMKPVTNLIYLAHDFIFAAKYNDKLGYYSDGFFIEANEITEFKLEPGVMQDVLWVKTGIVLENQQKMELKMSFPKISAAPWHRKNLKALKAFIGEE